MAVSSVCRRRPSRECELPERLAPLAYWGSGLSRSHLVSAMAERFHIQRQGGFAGVDLALFLMAYFLADPRRGLRGFYTDAREVWSSIGHLFDRRRLPSPASVSRMLHSVDMENVESLGNWLLTDFLGAQELVAHPAVQYRDAQGDDWHVLDYDPTHKALRQRALPQREGVPEGKPLGERIGKPGCPGRKRGQLHFNRSLLLHAGSGLLLHIGIAAGGGDGTDQLGAALRASRAFIDRHAIATDRTVVRLDGAYGGVPSLRKLSLSELHFVVRAHRPAVLDIPDVRQQMATEKWTFVPDAGTGPLRSALDVGWILLNPGDANPLRLRVVLSRYPVEGDEKPARGEVIDHVCYELYTTSLPASAWPAAEVVSLYYGRGGYMESRIHQINKEVAFHRVFAYHLPGQLLASTVAAFTWNLRIATGFLSNPPSFDEVPAARPAQPVTDTRVMATPSIPEISKSEPIMTHDTGSEDGDSNGQDEAAFPPMDSVPAAAQHLSKEEYEAIRRERLELGRREVARCIDQMIVGSLLEKRGWKVSKHPLGLLCPRGELFSFRGVLPTPTAASARFRAPHGTCPACPIRDACRRTGAKEPNYCPSLVVPPAVAQRVTVPPKPSVNTKVPKKLIVRRATKTSPRFEVRAPTFLPAEARRTVTDALRGLQALVELPQLPVPTTKHSMIAPSARSRRHGRHSHAENNLRYALPADVEVRVTLLCSHERGLPSLCTNSRKYG